MSNETRVPIGYDAPAENGVRPVRLTDQNQIVADLLGHAPANFSESKPRPFGKRDLKDLGGYRPQLNFEVADKLAGGDNALAVQLAFDCHPRHWVAAILQQVPELRERVQRRQALVELRNKLLTDPALKARLAELLRRDPAALQNLLAETANPKTA